MPGGVLEPLSAQAQKDIGRKFPSLPLERINEAVENYRIYRQHKAASAKKVREEIEAIVSQASALKLTIAMASDETRDQFSFAGAGRDLLYQAEPFLSVLEAQARAAFNVSPKPRRGDRAAPEGPLVRNLAAIVRDAGEEANAKPNGVLCQLVAIVLKDSNKNLVDIKDLVERSLSAGGKMRGDRA